MKAPLISLAVCCVGVLLALGICSNTGMSTQQANVGLAIFALSVLGAAVSLIWLVIRLITSRATR